MKQYNYVPQPGTFASKQWENTGVPVVLCYDADKYEILIPYFDNEPIR